MCLNNGLIYKYFKLKKPILFLSIYIFATSNIYSQQKEQKSLDFSIKKSEEIRKLFNTYNEIHEKIVLVYKIQLFHNENRYSTWKIKNKYEELYPSKQINFFYEPPYFKVTSEYFMTKISAEKKMDSIKVVFPDCFIITDLIPLDEF